MGKKPKCKDSNIVPLIRGLRDAQKSGLLIGEQDLGEGRKFVVRRRPDGHGHGEIVSPKSTRKK